MTASLTLIHHRLSHKHIRRRRVAIFSSLQSFQSLCASVQTHLLPIPVQARPRLLLPSLARIRFSLSFSLFLSHAYIHVHAHTHTHTHTHIFHCSRSVSLGTQIRTPNWLVRRLVATRFTYTLRQPWRVGTRIRVFMRARISLIVHASPRAAVITTLRR